MTCRFHGTAWSKTCQECLACLDLGAGPETIHDLVRRNRPQYGHYIWISAMLTFYAIVFALIWLGVL